MTKVLKHPVVWNALFADGYLCTVSEESEVWVVLVIYDFAVEWPEMELYIVGRRVESFQTVDLSAVVSDLAAVREAAIVAVAVEALEEVMITLAEPHSDFD